MKQFMMMIVLAACAGWARALAPMPETLDREEALRQARERTATDAPDAKTLTFAQARYVTYAPDGTSTMWVEFWTKALTEAGAKELRDVPLWYKEGFSEAEFQVAEAIRADGTVEPIDLRANVKAATSNSGNEANIYDPTSKRLVLTVPRVGVGDTLHIVLAYHTSRPRIPDTYYDFETFEGTEGPIPYASFTILAPKELPLRSTALLDEVTGTVTASRETLPDGHTLHRWVARNVPQTFAEENMPDESTEVQRVVVSTFATWEELSKWYWGLCLPHLTTTPAIDAKVRELTEGKATDAEKIEALFGFVAQSIRYMGIIAEDTAPGYEPHDVALTFENRYGVCRDKGALLVAMLRKAGYEAFPVLINAGSKRDREVPIPYFNHAVVAIDLGGKNYRLLDPTDDTARAEFPAYLSDSTYLVCRPEGDTLRLSPVPAPEENLMDIVTEGTLDAAGTLELSSSLNFGGMNDNAYRPLFVKNPPDRVRDRFDGLLKRVLPGAELVDFTVSPENPQDITQPLKVRLTARVPGYVVPDANGRTPVDLPFLSRSVGLVNFLFDGLSQPTRKYDWVIMAPCAVRERLTLRGFGRLGEPALLPDDPILKANGASYDVVCKRAKDGTLTLSRALELSHKTYTPEDYRSLRRFAESLRRFESLRPLFAKAPEQDADALVRRQSEEVTLRADGSVLRRQDSTIKILTFQGKRDLGERILWHNPAWQQLTINAAETTTDKGDRVAVTPKEISELDADNAALAPRYPAMRKTVVSLPAVEVGSTTRMDWQVLSKDTRPFADSVTFGGTYPTAEQRYTLTLPLALDGELRVAERNFGDAVVERSVVTNGTDVVRTWTFRDLPAVHPEPRTPDGALWRPTLYVGLRSAAAYRTFPALIAKAEAVVKAGSEKAAERAESLTEDLEDDDAKLRAIQTFMARRIRTLGPAWTQLPFGTFTAPDAVLAEGYGNRMDRLLLWMALLRAADFEPELVFSNVDTLEEAYVTRDLVAARDVPRWTRWGQPYLRLPDGRLIGDEGEFDEPGATWAQSRSLMGASGRVLHDLPEALRPHASETLRVVVAPSGDAVLSSETFRWGLPAGALRRAVRDFTPETRRRAIAEAANVLATGATPCSEYVVDTAAYPVRSRLAVEAKGYAVRQGRVLSVPMDRLLGAVYGLRGLRRENPIWQAEAQVSENVYDLWLPAGSEILSKPEPFAFTLPGGGSYTLTLETAAQPHTGLVRLTYRTRYVASPALLGSWLAPGLEELDRRLSAPNMKTLILRLPE